MTLLPHYILYPRSWPGSGAANNVEVSGVAPGFVTLRSTALVLLATPLLLTGCVGQLSSGTESGPFEGLGSSQAQRPIVIALLDSGTSPYYDLYYLNDDTIVEQTVPVPSIRVQFGPPEGEDPRERDKQIWETLEPGVLYHIAGTRLLGISFDSERNFPYVRDADFHGAATSYFAAREAPEAIIVSVQIGLGLCGEASCVLEPSIADGMEWIAQQDWIDVVSVSLALPANLPDQGEIHPDVERYLRASEDAARRGKIIVNGAGNDAAPPIQHYFNGPPWVIAVGGIEPGAKGEHVRSGKGVDVVANFTDFGPMYGDGENDMAWRSGTSFATPIVAGTLANALAQIQTRAPERATTARELREAMNASAIYFDISDWNPSPPGRKPLPDDVTDYLSAPIVSQAQMGWGYVEGRLSPEIARRIIDGDLTIPPEKNQAAALQPKWQEAREDYWATFGP